MNVGIAGAGAMAQAITQLAIKAGYRVMLSNSRGKQSLQNLTSDAGCMAGTVQEAAEFGDIVIIAIPLYAFSSLPPESLAGKVVVDLMNYFPHRDGRVAALDREQITTSELLAKHLPASRLVKAFNAITVEDIRKDARPTGSLNRRALPIAGDDPEAKSIVVRWINALGFDALDSGNLRDSWRFERFRPAYCVALDKETLNKTLLSTTRDTKVADGYWLGHR